MPCNKKCSKLQIWLTLKWGQLMRIWEVYSKAKSLEYWLSKCVSSSHSFLWGIHGCHHSNHHWLCFHGIQHPECSILHCNSWRQRDCCSQNFLNNSDDNWGSENTSTKNSILSSIQSCNRNNLPCSSLPKDTCLDARKKNLSSRK